MIVKMLRRVILGILCMGTMMILACSAAPKETHESVKHHGLNIVRYYRVEASPQEIVASPSKITVRAIRDAESAMWLTYDTYLTDDSIDLLARLLFYEANTMSWKGQYYTCSAILNYCDVEQRGLYSVAYDMNCFSVADVLHIDPPSIDTQLNVIYAILEHGRIPDICYFRTDCYHSFGTPVVNIDNHYFSKP